MNALLDFDRRYGSTITTVGSGSGLFSWILSHAADITTIAGMIGAVATAAIAVLALAMKLYGMIARARRNLVQRRRHFRDEPFEDGLG